MSALPSQQTVPGPQSVTFIPPGGPTLRGDFWPAPGAPTVVLLHGGGQTRRSWRQEAGYLHASGYAVLALDARGHGESDWAADGDYRLPALAADLMYVLKDVPRPLALVGASMGGMTSFYAIGSAEGQIADALVLVDIVPRIVRQGGERITQFMTAHLDGFATLDDAVTAVAAYSTHRKAPPDGANLMHNLRRREDGRLYWHWDPRILDDRPSESSIIMDTAFSVAAHVTLPTLLVRGGKSDLISDEGIAEFSALLPQMEVYTVPGAGHMVAGDDNSNFHAGIAPFLRNHLPPKRTQT